MKRILVCSFVVALLIGVLSVSQVMAADGKALFLEKKCNLCHSIESQDIAKTSEKMKGTDLSDLGSRQSDAAFVKGWLQQTELVEGKKHQKKWKGTDEELNTIVNWVLSLKQ